MRQLVLVTLLATALAAAVTVPLAFGSGDAHGPGCANITSGGGGENDAFVANPDGTGTFNFSMTLAAAACDTMTYTFYVSFDGGAFTTITGIPNGTVVTMPTQNYPQATADVDSVCVYATSSKTEDGEIADRAPDTGCLAYIAGQSPANQGFG